MHKQFCHLSILECWEKSSVYINKHSRRWLETFEPIGITLICEWQEAMSMTLTLEVTSIRESTARKAVAKIKFGTRISKETRQTNKTTDGIGHFHKVRKYRKLSLLSFCSKALYSFISCFFIITREVYLLFDSASGAALIEPEGKPICHKNVGTWCIKNCHVVEVKGNR